MMRRSMRIGGLLLAAAVMALSTVSAQATKPPPPPPPSPANLVFTATSFAFGQVAVGASATHDFTLKNNGKGSSGRIAVTLTPAVGPFSIAANNCAKGLDPKAACTVSVRYAPQVAGASDSAILKATAGSVTSNQVALSGTSPVPTNGVPSAESQLLSTAGNTGLAITLSGSDPDNDPLTYKVVSIPGNGSLYAGSSTSGHEILTGELPYSLSGSDVYYMPATDFSGSDSLTFKVNDGKVDSASAGFVSITVTPPNHPPTADNQSVTVNEGTQTTLTLTGSDPDGDSLAFQILSSPTLGYLVGVSGTSQGSCTTDTPSVCTWQIRYDVASGVHGSDSFTFSTNDGTESSPATVSITVNHVNTPPSAWADSGWLTSKNTPVTITLGGQDGDLEALTFAVVTGPGHGTLGSIGDPDCSAGWSCTAQVTYTPNTDYTGTDSFTFKVNDGTADSTAATIAVDVQQPPPVNNPPDTPADQTVWTQPGTPVEITVTSSDADGDDITFVVPVAPMAGGSLSDFGTPVCVTDAGGRSTCSATATYTPTGTDPYTDSIYVGALDEQGAGSAGYGLIAVYVENRQPSPTDQTVTVGHTSSVLITVEATDPDGDALTFGVAGDGPMYGTLSPLSSPASCTTNGSSDCTVTTTYTPDGQHVGQGADIFQLLVQDSHGGYAYATITIDITNDSPLADDNSDVSVGQDSTDNVITLTGSDPDGDAITFSIDTPPIHGTLSTPAGSCSISLHSYKLMSIGPTCSAEVTYTPEAGYNGTDSFTFHTSDDWDSSGTATVSINVVAPEPS